MSGDVIKKHFLLNKVFFNSSKFFEQRKNLIYSNGLFYNMT